MTIREQETQYSTHYRQDGMSKVVCGHGSPRAITRYAAFVSCPYCKYEIEKAIEQNQKGGSK